MSRKTGLAKKIAHTLMAMSIVYSSGINIVVNEVYAAEKIKEITTGGTFAKSGTAGNDFSAGGGITDGEDLSYTGVIKTSDLSSQLISIKATGGRGGKDNADSPTVMQGAKGGNAIAKVTIDGLSSVTTGDIAVSAMQERMAALTRERPALAARQRLTGSSLSMILLLQRLISL